MSRVLSATLVALFCLAAVLPSVAEELVSPPVTVWDDTDDDMVSQVIYNPDHDEYLVLFIVYVYPARSDIYARRLAGDGTPLSWFCVHSAAGEFNWEPRGAYSPAHQEYLVAWTREQSTGTEDDVLARFISWDGATMGSEFDVVNDADVQHVSDVEYNSVNDEYLVVYHNEWDSGLVDVAAQRVRASDGAMLSWANVATGPATADTRHLPRAAHNPLTNQYLIVYAMAQRGVYGKLAAADLAGVSVAPEIVIYDDPAGFVSYRSDVAAFSELYLVAWVQSGFARARFLDVTGNPLGPADGMILDDTMSGWSAWDYISVDFGHKGTFVLAWDAWSPTMDLDVHATAIRPGADGPIGPFITIGDPATDERSPALSCAAGHACMMAYSYEDPSSAGLEYDVLARQLRPVIFSDAFESGTPAAWTDVVP